MKLMLRLSVFSVLLSFGIEAQSLDPNRYQKIKSVVTQTGHLRTESLAREIYEITPEPLDYLLAIVKEPGLRIYAISQINDLIADFGGNSAKEYLESTVADERKHPSVRNAAAFSYGRIFYPSDKSGTENFLLKFSGNERIGGSVQNTLRELRTGKLKSVRFSDRIKKENVKKLKSETLKKRNVKSDRS
ncbi:hypothetical protein EHQ12_00075 [Leptospira gomenensis]|uniref:HEAT repeat domain-containing protein n=1 Tax=Leptospira gomenensis TaxID=2484974 RepID=A0A5F1Z1C3_9LEPT|nr:hypothetical protein [Leptospira gomenensis]TGK27935.1 hypothetical protein EHQ17_17735 [Leptospira gomenensis]TGK45459.1 hypothetical protein EHQ12_00075 [Leptospira gomenensis]TGK45846.1 hypothetical protein EHQ07_09240 [Leptospira gomenensis]TGK65228.1 hypothetical protein EHQ13_05685 [Leptospira gomenensis]